MRQPDEPDYLGEEYDHWRSPPHASWAPIVTGAVIGAVVIVSAVVGAACIFGVF